MELTLNFSTLVNPHPERRLFLPDLPWGPAGVCGGAVIESTAQGTKVNMQVYLGPLIPGSSLAQGFRLAATQSAWLNRQPLSFPA